MEVRADLDGFNKQIDETGTGLTKQFGGFAKAATAAFAGGLALKKGFDFLGDSFGAFEDAQKVAKQTEAVIKSTGGAAGLSADQFGDLATSISKYSGIDDEAIQSGENLLATFTNVRNGVGEGNDVFTEATKTLVDMGAALGGDPATNAVQLGKALNDPIKGISALTRVGVTFTDQQKDQIKAMQEAGDMAGAQKVILAELNKEFGGSAAAQNTATKQMQVAFGNLEEQIGGLLAPALYGLANVINLGVLPAVKAIGSWISDHKALVAGLAVAVGGGLVAAFGVWAAATWAEVAANVALGTSMLVAYGPAIAIGAAIAGVAAGLIYAYGHFQAFRDVVDTVITAVQTAVTAFVGAVTGLWHTFGDDILQVVQSAWSGISGVIGGVLTVIKGVVDVFVGIFTGNWGRAWDGVKEIFSGVWDAIRSYLSGIVGVITGLVGGLIDGVVGFFAGLPGKVIVAVGGLSESLFSWVADAVAAAPGKVGEAIGAITGWLTDKAPGLIKTAASGMWDGITDAFKGAINAIIRGWNAIEFKIPGFKVGPVGYGGFTLGVPDIPTLALGGVVMPTPGGTLVRVAEAGQPEAVIPLDRYNLDGIQAGGVNGAVLEELRKLNATMQRPAVTVNTTEGNAVERLMQELNRQQLLYGR